MYLAATRVFDISVHSFLEKNEALVRQERERILKDLLKSSAPVAQTLVVAILQLVILGSFDHYVFTIHQTLLLFWIVIGLSIKVTLRNIPLDTPSKF